MLVFAGPAGNYAPSAGDAEVPDFEPDIKALSHAGCSRQQIAQNVYGCVLLQHVYIFAQLTTDLLPDSCLCQGYVMLYDSACTVTRFKPLPKQGVGMCEDLTIPGTALFSQVTALPKLPSAL